MNQDFNKNNKNHRKRASIDGFTNRPTGRFQQGSGGGSLNMSVDQDKKTEHKSNKGIVGDFNRQEGFHATKQKPIVNQSKTSSIPDGHEPLIIDRDRTKKKKRWMFWKRNRLVPKKRLTKKQKIFRTSAGLATLLLLVVGLLGLKGLITLNKVLPGGGGAAALNSAELRGEGDGRVNILMLGRGGEGHEGADLTDTIIVASIDPIAKDAALVSVPRDLYLEVDGGLGSSKVNAVFANGKNNHLATVSEINSKTIAEAEKQGLELLEKTLENNLGIPMHYRAMIDFKGFEDAVDTVGGVTVDAPKAVVDNMRIDGQQYLLDVQPGVQQMDGFEALAYARSRFTSARGDFDRSERQRIIITALSDKILSLGTLANPQKISELLDNFGNHFQTNFSLAELRRLYEIIQEIPGDKINSIGLSDPPNNFVQTSNIGGLSVVVPTAGVGDYSDIQFFLRNALKDAYIKAENAEILVLNGTSQPGLASEKSDELKSFGYNVPNASNAPTRNYEKTLIVDLRNGQKQYTQNYLERRLGVGTTGALPDDSIDPGTADFVIILGMDQANL